MLFVTSVAALVTIQGWRLRSLLLSAVGLLMLGGLALDLRRDRRDRALERAQGGVLGFDLEGIHFKDLPSLRWTSVVSLTVEELRFAKGWAPFLVIELGPQETARVGKLVPKGRIDHREVDIDVGRGRIGVNLRALEHEPSFILSMGRRYLARQCADSDVESGLAGGAA
jgi:hypothetical protein